MILAGIWLFPAPLLTLLVYKVGKKSLKFDLSVIVLLQVAGLAYGLHAIHSERPWFMVHALDRYVVLPAKDVDFGAIEDSRFLDKPLVGPLFVVASMPADEAGRQRLLNEVMFQGKPDLDRRPEFWNPYEDTIAEALLGAELVDVFAGARPDSAELINAAVQRSGRSSSELLVVPIIGKTRDFALLVDRTNGEVLDALPVNPWL